jgi:hypothetical protein
VGCGASTVSNDRASSISWVYACRRAASMLFCNRCRIMKVGGNPPQGTFMIITRSRKAGLKYLLSRSQWSFYKFNNIRIHGSFTLHNRKYCTHRSKSLCHQYWFD